MISPCKNRFEGFGPHSGIHPSTPTHCFNDVILVPLATWVYLAILLILLLSNPSRVPYATTKRSEGEAKRRKSTFNSRGLLTGLYWLLIIGMLALTSVEIARLIIADLGIGLLPFNYVGILLALLVHIATRKAPRDHLADGSVANRNWRLQCATAIFWGVMAVVAAVTAASAKMEENMGYIRIGQQALYPVDDVFVDNLTMACVGIVLAGLETLTL